MTATWLITGASRGIGLELTRQVQSRGNTVIATCRDPKSNRELRDLDIAVKKLDVLDGASVQALADSLIETPIDVLVNNAGISGGRARLTELDFGKMNECFATNTLGPLRVTAALLPNLRAGERRLVANVTSRMGSIADNTSGGSYAYRSSKAALNMANRSMAHELGADGIICVVFHPGWVQTDMGGANAPLSVEDSVRGLLEVMDGLTTADNGRFLNYSGEEIPW